MLSYSQFVEHARSLPRFRQRWLDTRQERAVAAPAATPLFIVAGPGAGKTTVLVLRALKLVFVDGLLPEQVILTTFTRKAAAEIRSRIIDWGTAVRSLIQSDVAVQASPESRSRLDAIDLNRFVTGTLDSICEDTLIRLRSPGDPVPVLVEDFVAGGLFSKRALMPFRADQDLIRWATPFTRDGDPPGNLRDLLEVVRSAVDRIVHDEVDLPGWAGAQPAVIGRQRVSTILDTYRQVMGVGQRLDFAHLESEFLSRLRAGRLARFTQGVGALLVDEYQDTNPLQESIYFEIVRQTDCEMTVVGDDDQSLYRFRGATVELFRDYSSRFAQSCPSGRPIQRIEIVDNYRSTPEIIGFFNQFVAIDAAFSSARVQPPKPPIVSTRASERVPVLGMFRPTLDALARDVSQLLVDVFRGQGYPIAGTTSLIERDPVNGDFADAVLLSHTVDEFKVSQYQPAPQPRLPRLLRDQLLARGVEVFNPRGQALRDTPTIRNLLGLMLLCLDPPAPGALEGRLLSDMIQRNALRTEARRYLTEWRQDAANFIASNPQPSGLRGFVEAWQRRSPQGGMRQWPDDWPLLELTFKLLCWFPELRDDPEGQVHLEAVARCVAQASSFSTYRATILNGQAPHDDNSVRTAIQDIFVPLAEFQVDVDEELMPHVPRSRFPIMTIHQAKGLEFPLVVVDVGSEFTRNHPKTRFRRHPTVASGAALLEDELASFCQVGPLRRQRQALDRAFDDLVRLYYVAFSRPQTVLLLIGLDGMLRTKPPIPHVATGWRRDGTWGWHSQALGRKPPAMPDQIPLTLI